MLTCVRFCNVYFQPKRFTNAKRISLGHVKALTPDLFLNLTPSSFLDLATPVPGEGRARTPLATDLIPSNASRLFGGNFRKLQLIDLSYTSIDNVSVEAIKKKWLVQESTPAPPPLSPDVGIQLPLPFMLTCTPIRYDVNAFFKNRPAAELNLKGCWRLHTMGPTPGLNAMDVVELQLLALKGDADTRRGEGVQTCFAFASPGYVFAVGCQGLLYFWFNSFCRTRGDTGEGHRV